MKRLIAIWCALMLAGVFSAGCAYVVGQQVVRQDANGPAAAIATEAVIAMGTEGQSAQEVVAGKTDVSSSLLPFVMIYDDNKNLIATSAGYGSEQYQFPVSALSTVSDSHDNRVTWQPQPGLRFATVAIKYRDGYVVGAVSLREPERTIGNITTALLVGSALYAVGCAILLTLIGLLGRRRKAS